MAVVRTLVAVPLALLVTAMAIRAMVFAAPPSHPIRALETSFGGHPDALTDGAMRAIGTAAAQGQGVPPSAREALALVARRAPIEPEPFLVEATIAEMGNDGARAEPLLVAARTRDPRSDAARYFLANRYLKTKRIEAGLIEAGALSRLSIRASEPLVPALAAFARTPGAVPDLKRALSRSPLLREKTLALLAQDPRNVALVLALAPTKAPGAAQSPWQEQMVAAQVKAGDLASAERLWMRFAGVGRRGLLYNPQFRDTASPPPFNWALPPSSAGVAEASKRGGLDIVYYGREDALLARQLLRLAPGSYRLSMRIEGFSGAGGLAWVVQCLDAPQPFTRLPLTADSVAGRVTVPANCPGQWLELRGEPTEAMATTELTVADLALNQVGAGQ